MGVLHLWRNPDLFDQNDDKNGETTFLGMLHQLSPKRIMRESWGVGRDM